MLSRVYHVPRGLSAWPPLAITWAASGMSAVTIRLPARTRWTDGMVRDVEPSRHLEHLNRGRRGNAERVIRHQRQRDSPPVSGPIQQVFDDLGTRIGIHPDVHHDTPHQIPGESYRIQTLVAFSNVISRKPHCIAEADYHALNEFAVLVGVTSKGRKGTSFGHIRRLFRREDPLWADARIQGGCPRARASFGQCVIPSCGKKRW
jgi:hypothetical protein